MEWLDVLRRIEAGEDARTEFKRGFGDLSDIGKAVCAFGNGNGGLLVLGVDNAGTIVGVRGDAEGVRERLTNFLQSGCSVPVSALCGRHEDPNGWVHWIDIPRQPRGFEPLHYDGRFWIRRGGGPALRRPRPRNESMAHAMVVAGLMERRGRGWPLMRRTMREFNGTEPGLVNDGGGKFVRVTFRLDPVAD